MGQDFFLQKGTDQQRNALHRIKQASNLTWKEITQLLDVHKSMLFKYLREYHSMPLKRLEKLCEATEFDLKSLGKLELIALNNTETKTMTKPKLDEKLAEFLGALSGDGNIYAEKHDVSITCGAIADRDYVSLVVKEMFKELFGLEPRLYGNRSMIKCHVYSKELQDFLSNEFGFPVGKRKNKTHIPTQIAENDQLLIAYLRGLFDTDGSFYGRRKNKGVVEFISASPGFLLQIRQALEKLGFAPGLSGKHVYLYDQRQVDAFFKTIKPNNSKHSLKYAIFKETGIVPRHSEIIHAVVA
ncbi:MAG: LAGLIDADG family homing endonuclease [Candidatus Diapherotrites archaeon]|nr:LAGLIDADG family homing endonuclease [Candidatus Diapherotrites archaeon]